MPIFFQQDIDAETKLGIWKIEEEENFFLSSVSPQRNVSHPHKKLQHLAGRYLLKFLFPDFPLSLILIADTKKPYLEDEAYHFSISHCGDFAAAIVSKTKRVGVDIEIPTEKILKIAHKFLHEKERSMVNREWAVFNGGDKILENLTLLWSCKEAVFKWWGNGSVDFSDMIKLNGAAPERQGLLSGQFQKETIDSFFSIHYQIFPFLVLTWLATDPNVNNLSRSSVV